MESFRSLAGATHKNLFQEMDSRSETGSEELLSVSHYTGITLKRESLENEDDHLSNAESLVGYKLVEKQDLVINIMLAWNGSLGISPFKGITSPAYCVYRIKGNNNPEYFGYLLPPIYSKQSFAETAPALLIAVCVYTPINFSASFQLFRQERNRTLLIKHIKEQSGKISQFIQRKKSLLNC